MLLASAIDPKQAVADLGAAADELQRATMDPPARAALRIQILDSALRHVQDNGDEFDRTIDGVRVAEGPLRTRLEAAYREAARLADTPSDRTRLVDQANAVRPTTLV
jgi:serine/threonine-protein kinase PknG